MTNRDIDTSLIEYNFDHQNQIVAIEMIGDISITKILDTLYQINQLSESNLRYPFIINLSDCKFEFNDDELLKAIEYIDYKNLNIKKSKKVAIITTTAHQTVYATIFKEFTSTKLPIMVELFSGYKTAFQWAIRNF